MFATLLLQQQPLPTSRKHVYLNICSLMYNSFTCLCVWLSARTLECQTAIMGLFAFGVLPQRSNKALGGVASRAITKRRKAKEQCIL